MYSFLRCPMPAAITVAASSMRSIQPRRARLAELGWSVGTIYAASNAPRRCLTAQPRQQRLRELPLERYLMDIDDEWVLHRAHFIAAGPGGRRGYRRTRVVAQRAAGQGLGQGKLSPDTGTDAGSAAWRGVRPVAACATVSTWNWRNWILRRSRWRAEIHSSPTVRNGVDCARGRDGVANAETQAAAFALADDLDLLYGPRSARRDRLTGNSPACRRRRLIAGTGTMTLLQSIVEDRPARISGFVPRCGVAQAIAVGRTLILPRRLAASGCSGWS